MKVLLGSQAILLISGLLALILNRSAKLSNWIGGLGVVAAAATGLISLVIAYHASEAAVWSLPWPIPYGSFSLALDSLGILFLFPIYLLSALAALFGLEYLRHYFGKKNIGSAWFFFNLLVAGMVLVIVARNAVLFLLAWEAMAISSFFLVLFEGEKTEVSRAGLIYLVATHIGTLFLLVMFILLSKTGNSFDFSAWRIPAPGLLPTAIFLCAVIGFGTKAGFMPLHIWLPEAHPAAPSHISAVMSGVMIKTGIYGLVRILGYLGPPPAWWGGLLIGLGIVSGVFGILYALSQQDLKRLLAYSSIENIGIITLGIGLGVLGMAVDNPALTVLGFAGGLLHLINHAFFKGLLFLGAGSVFHETGTREIDLLGGLFKKMPVTGLCFLIGAAAICGLPPLNGFIGEFLIYFSALKSLSGSRAAVLAALASIGALALIGALAAAGFTKAFGIIFLGEPRSAQSRKSVDPGILMRVPMVILAGTCVVMGLGTPFFLGFFRRIVLEITKMPLNTIDAAISEATHPLRYVVGGAVFLYGAFILIAWLRRRLLRGREIKQSPTWGCGYPRPTPRMQYTASSFSQPIVEFFRGILRTKKHGSVIGQFFPDESSFKTETADLFSENIFLPLLKGLEQITEKLTWIQHGRLQIYILYILFTLIVLLIWKL